MFTFKRMNIQSYILCYALILVKSDIKPTFVQMKTASRHLMSCFEQVDSVRADEGSVAGAALRTLR